MLTTTFFTHLADSLMRAGLPPGALYLAVGRGQSTWDAIAPLPDRNTTRLTAEVARVPVPSGSIHFLDDNGLPGESPTPVLSLSASFPAGTVTGALRECGLFLGASASGKDSGTLLTYLQHAKENAPSGVPLVRTLRIDLSPGVPSPGLCKTRYLGNSSERELHDLEKVTKYCQIDEIPIDRRFYFGSIDQAKGMKYDLCAYCFGKEASHR